MSSSYVEVRESENGTGRGFLPLELNDIINESNGIDIEPKFESEMPKDHTYNKDPGSDKEETVEHKDKMNEETPKSSGRAQRGIKHKFIKPRTQEPVVKKGSPKKSRPKAIVEPLSPKLPREKSKSPVKTKIAVEVNNKPVEPELQEKRIRKRKVDDDFVTDMKQIDDGKLQGKKKAKPDLEKEADVSEPKDVVKKKSPVKNAKVAKAENASESKSTRAESPKSKPKVAKKDRSEKSDLHLPPGWTRKVVERKSGKTAGMCDVYIYRVVDMWIPVTKMLCLSESEKGDGSQQENKGTILLDFIKYSHHWNCLRSPDGIKFRSRPDIAAYLYKTKSKLNVEDFSFKKTMGTTEPSTNDRKPISKAKTTENATSKKKAVNSNALKTGKTLKVKISTPKKHDKAKEEKKTKPYPVVDCKPSTSGLQSKRLGVNRKRKFA